MTLYRLSGAVALAACVAVTPAVARDLSMAPGFAPGSIVNQGAEAFANKVTELTGGDITFTIHPLTLLSVPQMLNGVRDGVADVGTILPMVFAAQFADVNLISDLAMLGTYAPAMAGATTEYILTCEPCLAEYEKNNVVYLGSGSTPEYGIQSTRPFTAAEDLRGAKLRSPNATFNRWIEHFGGVALTLPGNEIFEAVKQGVVSGALLSSGELRNIRMIDIVTDVTVGVPGGTYNTINIANVNRDLWQELTPEQRKAMVAAGAHAIAETTVGYVKDGAAALEAARAQGIKVHEASPEFVAASQEFVKQDLAKIATLAGERGVQDAEAKIARFSDLVTKWQGLTDGVELSAEALGELYRKEIFEPLIGDDYAM
jgi:TRAP-type C4-dicarboxylate transport system substrate-binding protein